MPVKSSKDMEKINTKDYNGVLETTEVFSKVKAVDTSGNDILVLPGFVAAKGGCGKISSSKRLKSNTWYRIAVGERGNVCNSTLLMIGNEYNGDAPCSQLLCIFADGYSNNQSIIELANAGRVLNKARILYKSSATEGPVVEIFIGTTRDNMCFLAYSSNIKFTFQDPVEVSETPESGYSVKEFIF